MRYRKINSLAYAQNFCLAALFLLKLSPLSNDTHHRPSTVIFIIIIKILPLCRIIFPPILSPVELARDYFTDTFAHSSLLTSLVTLLRLSSVDIINIDTNSTEARPATDNNIDMCSADLDTSLNAIIGMIIMATLTGSTIVAAFSAFIILVAIKITTPEVASTEATLIHEVAAPTDADITSTSTEFSNTAETNNITQKVDTPTGFDNFPAETPGPDIHNDDESSVLIVLANSNIHCHRHDRPAPPPTPPASPVRAAVEPHFTASGFFIENPDNSSAQQTAETSATRFTASGFLVESTDNSPAQPTTIDLSAQTSEGNNKFTESGFVIESPDNTSVHDTPVTQKLPKGSNNRFTDSGFLIDSQDNTSIHDAAPENFASLGPMIFTSSPALQTPIGRPPPTQTSKGCSNNNKFTPSGFLIESADKLSIRHAHQDFAALGPMIFTSPPAPETPTGPPRARKPIFASPVGEPLSHTRKVSNE